MAGLDQSWINIGAVRSLFSENAEYRVKYTILSEASITVVVDVPTAWVIPSASTKGGEKGVPATFASPDADCDHLHHDIRSAIILPDAF